MLHPLYPGGKRRACNLSYDDGVTQDVRLVELLNQYGLKGTFNLNSELMQQQFQWAHPSGMTVKRLSVREAAGLYRGHEVASHTATHPYMDHFSPEQLRFELDTDRAFLQQLFGDPIFGYATPFYFYNDTLAQCVQDCGFRYARISQTDPSYSPWRDPYAWRAGIFHLDPGLEAYVNGFLQTDTELALCQIVGHSYDLEVEQRWDQMESILRRLSNQEDVWAATHLQILQYLQAIRRLLRDGNRLENPSDQTLWFALEGQTVLLPPKQILFL